MAVTAATVFLAANQAATTTATLAATLPTVFNIHNLQNNVKACHQSHLYSSFLMTKDNIQRQMVEKTNLVDSSKDSEPMASMVWMYLNGLEKKQVPGDKMVANPSYTYFLWPKKVDEPHQVRITTRENLLAYDGNVTTNTASMETIKAHWN